MKSLSSSKKKNLRSKRTQSFAANGIAAAQSENEESALVHLVELLKPYKVQVTLALITLIGLTLVNIAVPRLIGIVFDRVFTKHDWALLWIILVALLLLYVLRNLLYFYSKYTAVQMGENICFTLRKQIFERMQRMNLQYYQGNNPGKLSSRVMNDSSNIQQFIQSQVPKLLQAALLFLGIIATIYAMNWQLALVSTIILPLHLAIYNYFKRPIKQASRLAQEHMATATGNIIEKFLGIEVVKGFTAEQRENAIFQEVIDRSRQSQLQGQRYHIGQKVIADILIGLSMVSLIGFGAYQVIGRPPAQRMQPGAFISFFIYIRMLYPTVTELMSGLAKLSKASASIERVFGMLEGGGEEESPPTDIKPDICGEIRFEHISFRYSGQNTVLDDISFTIPAGKTCVVTGPSGAGKSTLVNLLPRFNNPSSGRIFLDGENIKNIDMTYLRENIGFAFQECFLFGSSIMENLQYANPAAKKSKIIEIAKRTGADDFIQKLPNGYDTLIGDSGVNLSRGEKQLINLARAMLKNPKILIMDEATASIDDKREAAVLSEILQLMKGKTVLIISHRPEALKHADITLSISAKKAYLLNMPSKAPPEASQYPDKSNKQRRNSASGTWSGLTMAGLLMIATAIGAMALATPAKGAPVKQAVKAQPISNIKKTMQHLLHSKASLPIPEGAGKFIAEPNLNGIQVAEMLDILTIKAKTLGYSTTNSSLFPRIPQPVKDLRQVTDFIRNFHGQKPRVDILEIGYKQFLSQPIHVWIYGITITPQGVSTNKDIASILKKLAKARQEKIAKTKHRTIRKLDSGRITLSYVSVSRALGVLRALGYNVVQFKTSTASVSGKTIVPTTKINTDKLPLIMPLPAKKPQGKVGNDTLPTTLAGRRTDLLVFYSPSHPEAFGELKHIIRHTIDVPARQIVIEAMVLEISQSALNQLGIQWKLQTGWGAGMLSHLGGAKIGTLPEFSTPFGTNSPTLDITINNAFHHWQIQLQALIKNGQAQILSRPSILTLNNRQAYIHVGQKIPIATSIEGLSGNDNIKFQFTYEQVGISLNVRPRVSADGQDVSMQIYGEVSSTVPGQALELKDSDGRILATAPRISQRQVQTYTRIANNTPFIIGGLISKSDVTVEQKVPLLGDIPILGTLFKTKTSQNLKREVIIVITPYVLPQDKIISRDLPKQDKAFDRRDNKLFRSTYRIRSEDVFDLDFLTKNKSLQRLQNLSNQIITKRPALAKVYPYNQFVHGNMPGERILVFRQMYEVIKRLKLAEDLNDQKMIFFKNDPNTPVGYSVEFLRQYLDQLKKNIKATGSGSSDIGLNNKALAITFTLRSHSNKIAQIMKQPVPDIRLVNCPDQSTWEKLLWKLNQPDSKGRQRYTILIHNQYDLTRLKRAVMVKQVVNLNGSSDQLKLENFSAGQILLLPSPSTDKVNLIDAKAAKYFFLDEQYYPALQQRMSEAVNALKKDLHNPKISRYLDQPLNSSKNIASILPQVQINQ